MTEELMVGTIGWDHNDWVGDYYTDDLPDDWRFAYYSNDYRSVLVPADHISSEAVASEWTENCDEEFRFVVEISKTCLLNEDETMLQSFLQRFSSLRSHLAGFYLPLDKINDNQVALLQSRVGLLQPLGPLCIDCDQNTVGSGQLQQLVVDENIGLCWHPASSTLPTESGALMLALSDEDGAKAQRHLIEVLEKWMQQSHGLAGLFLHTPAAASQARIIAEMLGV